MSPSADTDAILKKAKEQELKYNWLEAAKSYEQTLDSASETVSSAAETWGKIGFCYSRASRQTDTLEQFKKLRQLSVAAYKEAAKLFEKEDSPANQGRSAECNAIAGYVSSWLVTGPSEKRRTLDECRMYAEKSLVAYESAGDKLSYGRMSNSLLLCLFERLYFASDAREMRRIAKEGIDCANKAITVLSELGDQNELLRAYFTISLQSWYAANVSEREERKELVQRSLDYSNKALQLSKEVDNPYYTAMSDWAAAFTHLLFTKEVESSLEYAKEMLQQGETVKDNYLKGVASYVLAWATNWLVLRKDDPDKKKEGHEKIIRYAEDALGYLQLVSHDLFIAQAYWCYTESYSSMALDVEATPDERQATLEKAVEIGRRGLEHANRSGSLDAMVTTLHALSKALHFYSNLRTEADEKTKLLEEALIHRQEYNKIVERLVPSNDWMRGVGKNYEGLITSDLAKVEKSEDRKRVLLENAVSDMEDCVSRCRKWILSRPVPTLIATVGRFEDGLGGILTELHQLTEDENFLRRANEVYGDAAKKFKKINLPSRTAESYWKIARNQDRLGKHQNAAENFENAFTEYKDAAQKTINFAEFYLDYAEYMKAWSEIERAKNFHNREEYSTAMKHYENTATVLKPSGLWSYLSPNFLALSVLEQAEDLSRKEKTRESIEAFKKAAEIFKEAKQAFDQEIEKIQVLDEKEKATELSKASILRKDYCLARIYVEEARVFDKEGAYAESAEKHDSAATAFEKLLNTLETEADRKEIRPIVYMCRAWQKMKMADGRASPKLYQEASELFLEAREHATKDRTSLLASGNNAFCKALEFGTEFEATRVTDDFLAAKKFLESAASYYLKAGFERASTWTSATEILFDAYNYMVSAELEVDPEKKMKIYLLAERCLERSAGLYETAGYTGKRDEVIKTLTKVKEKREFALSLGEMLTAPGAASSTSLISAPHLTVEEPVGLLKFESALVQANLVTQQTEVVVGEDLGLEIQLANLGKNTAFLIRVEEIVPQGFDLIKKPDRYMINDGFLNLKGRKLPPLETEEMKLTLKPKRKGKFVFIPKVHYMDETGKNKSCELEQVTINVKELGIRGWLRGPG